MDRICQNCAAYDVYGEHGDKPAGHCHRHAPRPLARGETFCWPVVLEDDWCLEFLSLAIA
jgi:hypothetical protein